MDLLLGHNKNDIGQPIVDESKDASVLKQAGQLTIKWLKAQVPYDQAKSAIAMATGTGDERDSHKVIGPMIGLTYSKVTGGDQEAIFRGEEAATRARNAEAMPAVRDLVKESTALRTKGDTAGAAAAYAKAEKQLLDTGLTQKEVNATLRSTEDPKTILTAQQMKAFNAHASEELKAKLDKVR